MAIQAQTFCSECDKYETRCIKKDETAIVCIGCGRSTPSLPPEEYKEVEALQRSQLILTLVTIGLTAAAAFCLYQWMGSPDTWGTPQTSDKSNLCYAAIVCTVAAMVTAALASRKKVVIEY